MVPKWGINLSVCPKGTRIVSADRVKIGVHVVWIALK